MECATPLGALRPSRRRGTQGRHGACSATSSGSPRPRSPPTPRTSTRCSPPTSRWRAQQIEAHGGVVEKFIGDAVVGVFGVPAAHEDDPERAVRAGLRIVEDAEELEARRRRSAEAARGDQHRGGARPPRGHRRARARGFSPGTRSTPRRASSRSPPRWASRSGLGTYEATAAVFDYEELEPATLKGKTEPVRVFHAKSPLARFGTDLTRTARHPVHRSRDRPRDPEGHLRQDASRPTSPQLVTVVGEPGLGKSRIVAELFALRRRPSPSWSPGARGGACPTGRASRSGRSERS